MATAEGYFIIILRIRRSGPTIILVIDRMKFSYSIIITSLVWVFWLPSILSSVQERSVTQFSSVAQSCPTLCNPMDCSTQASLTITNSWSLLKLMSVKSMMPSNHLILCHPLLLLPSIFPRIRIFSSKSVLHIRWPRYWSFRFSFSISPYKEYSGLISFRMNWLDLLAVQGTLKSLLQHHSSKASILQCSVFFMVQLTFIHYYWKNQSFD